MSKIESYEALPWHEQRALRRQLATDGSPLRKAAIAWLDEQYQEYRQAGGELIALAWALEVLPGDLWNALFCAACRVGSYGAPTVLLVRDGGQYKAVYKR